MAENNARLDPNPSYSINTRHSDSLSILQENRRFAKRGHNLPAKVVFS